MEPPSLARKVLKRILLGPSEFPQQCALGLRDPQSEVSVWLHGLGSPRDVTHSHMMACAAPLTIGIGFHGPGEPALGEGARLSLSFREQDERAQCLVKIYLQHSKTLPVGNHELYLFKVLSCRNHCLPKIRLWTRYLYYAYRRWRQTPEVQMTAREVHSMIAFFVCPRPVVLVSVTDGRVSNIFPMNLMGPIGGNYFSFALNSTRPVTSLVERAGRVALSSLPMEYTSLAYELAKNHKREHADWNLLPFSTRLSTRLGLPVPEFSLRVRELQIEATRKMGSHTLFVARIIQDESWADGLQFFTVHGFYQAWRQRTKRSR
ncbi:MAG TPA: flavin reductase [Terriglobia bacterium]|nr:flavin reductase [Terriglobia bacterium]